MGLLNGSRDLLVQRRVKGDISVSTAHKFYAPSPQYKAHTFLLLANAFAERSLRNCPQWRENSAAPTERYALTAEARRKQTEESKI
jgi:hypothetical protein